MKDLIQGAALILERPFVQAQRREAWGELPPDAASSVVRPRPHGRSAFTRRAHVLRMNRMKEGTHDTPTTHSTWAQPYRSRGYGSWSAVVTTVRLFADATGSSPLLSAGNVIVGQTTGIDRPGSPHA